ncbi:hypothetical protein [Phenylobacterium soli]|uniref:Uncharacterized protein n=1 Tax=Phenylobacterium soli TaxID=2170551 RepID=A0A328AJX4_9CAUL|nr:hypothetical protein [Phenylobacterium soli]RAK53704.1 hypothetical protein DJ017_03760 [Phenylobacterium soli]
MKKAYLPALVAGALMLCAWGAPKMPDPAKMAAPAPIEGTGGKYMSPFTSDGVTAAWVTKSMQVRASTAIGGMAGNYAGQKAMEQVPFIGGFLGKKAGESMGRSIALKAIGGEEFLKSSSDLSFNSLEDMSRFMYAKYSTAPEYPKILEATESIYPEMKDVYLTAVVSAPVK